MAYLLPELDRLSDKFHVIYYDQRGRGRSTGHVKPEDVTLESEMADLDQVRAHFHLDKVVLLGHSWGQCWRLNTHFATRNGSPAWC
jgi:proline iminopeptidase